MENFMLITIIINLLINLIMLLIFELKRPSIKTILPMVVIVSASSLGRLVFSFIPQIQPVTALIIISGSSFGSLFGFVSGSLSALVSNMFLGQGTWTLYQMTAWGLVGLISGIIGKLFKSKKYISKLELIIFLFYGFIAAIIFSLITDLHTIAFLGNSLNISSAIAVFMTGVFFNITHGIFNIILIFFMYIPIKEKMIRIKNK